VTIQVHVQIEANFSRRPKIKIFSTTNKNNTN